MDDIKEVNQASTATGYERYPKIFDTCRKYYTERISSEKLNILSFGCSTGEECVTLVKYFPSATVLGVDINNEVLVICNKKHIFPNISFMPSNYENIKSKGPFDMIFCLSVLCKYDETANKQNISQIYSFSKFQKTIESLDQVLTKDGLLVIYNSNFRFSDSSIYGRYKVLFNQEIDESGFVPKFDKNNNLIAKELQKYNECIFIKAI